MREDLDKILQDIEADKQVRLQEDEKARKMLEVDEETANALLKERQNKVSEFKLNLALDEEAAAPDNEPAAPVQPDNGGIPVEAIEQETPQPEDTRLPEEHPDEGEHEEAPHKKNGKKKNAKNKTAWGCVRGIIYTVLILAASGFLAYYVIVGGLDFTGLNKSDVTVPVTLTEEQCKDTAQVAQILHDAGVIDQPFIFRLYCKLAHADGEFQPQDEAAVSADMGYRTLISTLQTTVRKVVTVTFPEGSTLQEIAEKLEKNGVCSVSDFYLAMTYTTYTYDFLSELPSDEEATGRINKLEGYIFPDTYDFYVGSSGETVVNKFLANFNNRVDATMRAAMKAKGMTLNQVVTLASIIQWEAASKKDMYWVSRVLHNRLEDPAEYPRLQCDSTWKYINSIYPPVNGAQVENAYYDSYVCVGLPVGPINNPGLDTIDAAINPSEDADKMSCYFFAIDTNTGITYYTKTYAQHVAICKRYSIGMYAQ